jgi:hypothetical protein
MATEEFLKSLFDLYSNPFFKKEFLDFFLKAQQEGMEAAKKFREVYPAKQFAFPNISEIFEMMANFYTISGFVPFIMYEERIKENKQLERENMLLKNTIKDLSQKMFTENGKAMQESWNVNIEKHIEMSREIAKGFLDIFRQSGGK